MLLCIFVHSRISTHLGYLRNYDTHESPVIAILYKTNPLKSTMELLRYFENPFYIPRLKFNTFTTAVEIHIARLSTNNPGGIYDAIIAETKLLFAAFKETRSLRDSEFAEQQGSTITTGNARAACLKLVRNREGYIRYKFGGTNTAGYIEFFPEGLKELSSIRLMKLDFFMQRMVAKATNYQAVLGPELLAEFEVAYQAFQAARHAQTTNMVQTKILRTHTHNARKALADQLMRNLHTIGLHNIDNPEAAANYFDQSLFTPPRGKKKQNPDEG